jgi:hypothetical protein
MRVAKAVPGSGEVERQVTVLGLGVDLDRRLRTVGVHHGIHQDEPCRDAGTGIPQPRNHTRSEVAARARPAEEHRAGRHPEQLLGVRDGVPPPCEHVVGRLGEVHVAEALDVVERQHGNALRGELESQPVRLRHVEVSADEGAAVHPHQGTTARLGGGIPIQARRHRPNATVDRQVARLDVPEPGEAALQG